jgi:hypothetical protein
MWENLVNSSGYDWEMIGEVKNEYDYYEIEVTTDIRKMCKLSKNFLTAPIQWQTG